jgi:hypothetical protein
VLGRRSVDPAGSPWKSTTARRRRKSASRCAARTSEAKIEDITTGKNYEAVALDYIATFNGAVTQGVNPLKALMAMCQACAIVMGQCIRAGLRLEIALGLISFIVKNARKASGEVRIITKS